MEYDSHTVDWDPKSEAVLRDQVAAYDWMRENRPVAYSEFLGWSLFRHEDLLEVLHAPSTYSNAVSKHLSLPNGLDPPEHGEFRRIIDPYFSPDQIAAFEPSCRAIATQLIKALLEKRRVEIMGDFAKSFAVRVQCAFLGWPSDLYEPLALWAEKNQAATLAEDREAMRAVAQEFAGFVTGLLRDRREAGLEIAEDLTSRLLQERVHGRRLSDEEIISILRNWTVGEIGSISTAIGNLVQFLGEHPEIQEALREDLSRLPFAIEEILRIHSPLVANRRITTRPVGIRGRCIDAGERISLIWVAANRDGRVFADPQTFRWDRDQSNNLLYGAGVHACPGAPLARLQMRVVLEELLRRTEAFGPMTTQGPTPAVYPVCGFSYLPLEIRG